ncbi:hypothetical protein [Bacillus norwichensis]|uniref:Antigen I/II N-terminal domain-containing protein n=1 Tax=Bacillus norwichensis TaxID=2762217 RepID=A0ABR8VL18_9BACI|nr:hypothetical protein [Bacillus norwichensis]MBD8005435.1 hypothetical protein [Bacillus norwichensis]
MKKLIMLITFAMLLMVSACGKDMSSNENVEKEEEEQGVEIDKGLLNVEVTLPKDFFKEEDVDEMIAQAKEDGVKEAIKNEDGSITYKMSKSDYKEMMKEIDKNALEYIDEIKTSEDFPSIKEVIHNKSFSEFTLSVDQEAFESGFDGFAALGLGMTGLYYQVFAGTSGEKAKVTITLKNADSGEVFNTLVYPDDLEEEEGQEQN